MLVKKPASRPSTPRPPTAQELARMDMKEPMRERMQEMMASKGGKRGAPPPPKKKR